MPGRRLVAPAPTAAPTAPAAAGRSYRPASVAEAQRRYGNRHVQRLLAGGDLDASTQGRIHAARGGGQALDRSTSTRMGGALGADLTEVRVHADARAAELSRRLGAAAFTVGQDVFFGQGRYRPDTPGGRRLLAHELAHTVQQGPTVSGARLRVGPAGDRHERDADRVAAEVVRRADGTAAAAEPVAPVARGAGGAGGAAGMVQRKIGIEIETTIPMQELGPSGDYVDLSYKTETFVDRTGAPGGGAGTDQFHVEADTSQTGSIAEFVTGARDTRAEFVESVTRLHLFVSILRGMLEPGRRTMLSDVAARYRRGVTQRGRGRVDLSDRAAMAQLRGGAMPADAARPVLTARPGVAFGGTQARTELIVPGKTQVTAGVPLENLERVTRALVAGPDSSKQDLAEVSAASAEALALCTGDIWYADLTAPEKERVRGFVFYVLLLIKMGARAHRPYSYAKAAYYLMPRVRLSALYSTLHDDPDSMYTEKNTVDGILGELSAMPVYRMQQLVVPGFTLEGATEFGPKVADWLTSIRDPGSAPLDAWDYFAAFEKLAVVCTPTQRATVLTCVADGFLLLDARYPTGTATLKDSVRDTAIALLHAVLAAVDGGQGADFDTQLTIWAPAAAVTAYQAELAARQQVDLMARGTMTANSGSLGAWGEDKASTEGAVLEFRRMRLLAAEDPWPARLLRIYDTAAGTVVPPGAEPAGAADVTAEVDRILAQLRGALAEGAQATPPAPMATPTRRRTASGGAVST
ncbi:MAG: DUF4157 domain-containing protein [Pseudonocardia sp.]